MKEGLNPRPNPAEQSLVPLPRNEANQYLHNLVYGDIDFSSDAETKRILTQQEGLSALNRFLQRRADFDTLGVFSLDLSGEKYRRASGQYQFYLGRLEEGTKNPYYLSVSPAHYLGHESEQLFVVPRVAQIGDNPYYWIEFTEEVTEDAMRPSFLSYRLKPEQSVTKIDSKYWRSLEEQLLVDFIQGENGITTSDLRPFNIKLNPKGHPYSFGAVQDLKVNLTGNSQIMGGDELLVVPQTDPQDLYSWIELYKQGQTGEEPTRVSTYRILQEEKRLFGQGWRNPETQYLLDYLNKEKGISFDNLRPVRVSLLEHTNQLLVGTSGKKNFYISIGNSTELGLNKVVLVPKQDHKRLYHWVEAYKFDPETGDLIGEPVASARMIQGTGFERTGWSGAGRQSLIDYSKGERTFEELLPITLQVGANTKMIDVWGVQKEHFYLTLSVKSGLKTGDNVELVPIQEEDGVVTYKMVRDNVELGSYSFNRNTKQFSIVELHDVRNMAPQPRDLLVDYSKGKAGFEELEPLKLKVRKNPGMIDILSKGDMRIYITPAKSFNLAPNDEVELVPEEERDGRVTFAFVKEGEVLGKYTYESQTMKFRRQEGIRSVSSEPKDTTEADNYLRGLVFREDEI